MTDDWVARVLVAIEEAERLASALISTVNPTTGEWVAAGSYGTEIRDSRDHLVVKHSWPDEIAHIIRHAPAAVLRRCAADRRRLERHTPIPDHGRFSDDWADECPDPERCDHDKRPKVCRTCRDYAGDPLPAPCPDLLDLADSYGLAPESSAVHGIDLSGIDLGEIPEAERDRIAAKLDALHTVTFKVEGYLVPREHVDSTDCWCKPIGPAFVHRDPTEVT